MTATIVYSRVGDIAIVYGVGRGRRPKANIIYHQSDPARSEPERVVLPTV